MEPLFRMLAHARLEDRDDLLERGRRGLATLAARDADRRRDLDPVAVMPDEERQDGHDRGVGGLREQERPERKRHARAEELDEMVSVPTRGPIDLYGEDAARADGSKEIERGEGGVVGVEDLRTDLVAESLDERAHGLVALSRHGDRDRVALLRDHPAEKVPVPDVRGYHHRAVAGPMDRLEVMIAHRVDRDVGRVRAGGLERVGQASRERDERPEGRPLDGEVVALGTDAPLVLADRTPLLAPHRVEGGAERRRAPAPPPRGGVHAAEVREPAPEQAVVSRGAPQVRKLHALIVAAAVLAFSSRAAAEPIEVRDVLEGQDLSDGWRCFPGGEDGACRDIPIPDGQRSLAVRAARSFRLEATKGVALSLGHFAAKAKLVVNGRPPRRVGPGLVLVEDGLVAGQNQVAIEWTVSSFRGAPAWDGRVRLGTPGVRTTGLVSATRPGGGTYVLFVPTAAASGERLPMIVALHAWGVGVWAYVGAKIYEEAERRGFFVLTPDGLGNSLYNPPAEAEVLATVDHVLATQPVDPERLSALGASMGGAGATTVAYRHPDRFAFVASFYGDCEYAPGGYTSAALPTAEARRAASPCHLAENAYVPTMLVHGMRDRVSSPRETTRLDRRLAQLERPHTMILSEDDGHTLQLFDRETPRAVERALSARRPPVPTRIRFQSPDEGARRVWWIEIVASHAGAWAAIDVEAANGDLIVHRAENVRRLVVHLAGSPFDRARPPTTPRGGPTVEVVE